MSDAIEIFEGEHWDKINKVVEIYLKGETRPTEIAKQLNIRGINGRQVSVLLDEWRMAAYSGNAVNQRAREALTGADRHYSMLIAEAWDTLEEAKQVGNLGQRNAATKLAADIESKRMELLHKAGVLENQDAIEQMLEEQAKRERVEQVLKEVVQGCDHCRPRVARMLYDEVQPVSMRHTD